MQRHTSLKKKNAGFPVTTVLWGHLFTSQIRESATQTGLNNKVLYRLSITDRLAQLKSTKTWQASSRV